MQLEFYCAGCGALNRVRLASEAELISEEQDDDREILESPIEFTDGDFANLFTTETESENAA